MKPVTKDEIARVLAALDPAELTRLVTEKKQASLEPMIAEYNQTENRLADLKKAIQDVNPHWRPATLADRILVFINSKGRATAVEIVKEFTGSATPFLIKSALKKKADSLWAVARTVWRPSEPVQAKTNSLLRPLLQTKPGKKKKFSSPCPRLTKRTS